RILRIRLPRRQRAAAQLHHRRSRRPARPGERSRSRGGGWRQPLMKGLRGPLLASMPALLAVLAGSALATSPVAAQDLDLTAVPPVPRDYRPALTAWGEPDLRGTWPVDHLNFTPLQRPPEQAGRYYLTEEEYAARQQMLAQRGQAYATEIEEETIGMGH